MHVECRCLSFLVFVVLACRACLSQPRWMCVLFPVFAFRVASKWIGWQNLSCRCTGVTTFDESVFGLNKYKYCTHNVRGASVLIGGGGAPLLLLVHAATTLVSSCVLHKGVRADGQLMLAPHTRRHLCRQQRRLSSSACLRTTFRNEENEISESRRNLMVSMLRGRENRPVFGHAHECAHVGRRRSNSISQRMAATNCARATPQLTSNTR